MLSRHEIEDMKETEEGSLPAWCRLERAVKTKDPSAGRAWTYNLVVPDFRCDIVPNDSAIEVQQGARDVASNDFILTAPSGTVINNPDRLMLLDSEGGSVIGQYEIVEPGVGDPYETAVEVRIRKVS